MSSRRDSRTHISERQNDALLEFENFKRKYLLVNKHITKLNSTLSVRVEELNAQVSSLYVENLRLRASEITLASQLRREREKTHRVVDEAENAVGTLMRQLTGIRTALDIRPVRAGPSSPTAKRRPQSSPVHPSREATRLVKPPADAITQIRESDEEDADEEDDTPTRLVTTRRPSSSRLPLPKLVPSPHPPGPSAIPHINLAAGATKRKARGSSALLTVEHMPVLERSPSPIVRSTSVRRSRKSSGEREDENQGIEGHIDVGTTIMPIGVQQRKHDIDKDIERMDPILTIKPEGSRNTNRKSKSKELLRVRERETETLSNSERESSEGAREKDKRRFGIKDVTNSPRKASSEFAEEKPPEGRKSTTRRNEYVTTPTDAWTALPSSTLPAPLSTHTPTIDTSTPRPTTSPLPETVSTPATDGGSEGGENAGGRERRTRKSVNYAEPKLNTKMRKPDPPPETVTRPRVSAGTSARRRRSIPTPSPDFQSDDEGDADVEGSGSSTKWIEGRRKTVHNTAVSVPRIRTTEGDIAEGYGMWESDGRRHSMAV